ncbi:hypothetical protein YA36_14280 [Klebsiella aerogenes]|uniref:phage protein n=1 Tax=Klebsiella aerogenes TaxID=548 RepID=UPI00063BFA06|nr:hypothetical protein [Klebsiella aerogenes]KLF56390.1 hypothetical protein YA36_14280 [Klebsiella aerogenes]
MPLFLRTAELIVGKPSGEAVSIRDLRFEFDIQKTSSRTANKCNLKVYNASPSTISMMETVNNLVILKAGYEKDIGVVTIFTGTVCRSLTYQDGADVLTEMELRDSVIPLRDAKISASQKPNTSALSVLKLIASNFGMPLKIGVNITDKQYVSGFAFNGTASDAMDRVCNFLGLEWSAQDGELQIIKKGGVYADTAVVLSKDTGMIGYPRREAKTMTEKSAAKEGIKYGQKGVIRSVIDVEDPTAKMKDRVTLEVQGYRVQSLLNPAIYPGAYVKLISRGIDGEFFRVEEARYNGDTHGQAWGVEALLRYPKNG